MSNPASFWAAKSNCVKSPQAPAHVAEPVAPREPLKKKGMALKGTTNGIEKTNWADSDDEEEFLASFTSSGRVQELEKTIAAKVSRITDLTTALQQKEGRITELESTFEEQKDRLTELQANTDALTTQIAELKKENHNKSLHVQKLVAEVNEKDRRIAALETEVDEHCATIAELDVGDSSTQVSSHDTPAVTKEVGTSGTSSPKVKVREGEVGPAKKAAQPTTKEVTTGDDAPVIPSPMFAHTKTAGPTVNLSGFPIFATPATVKQTTPPPPAPMLKMPVDLSKFAKKPACKTVTPRKKVEAASAEVVKDGPVPQIDPSSDIRTKSHEERVLFANGPKVQVRMGDISLATVPMYVLMQCSPKAFKHFSNNPDATSFTLPAGSMDANAATAHLEWMKEMTYQGRVYSVTLYPDEKFDDKNLQICRAARALGLNNMYVGHFTKIFCDRIRSNAASYDFLSKVAALAYPENDPILDCLANNLANLRLRNAVKKHAGLEALLKKHTGLKDRVEKIEERMRKKQEDAKMAKGLQVVRVGKKMDV
ncbi:hypothetical protein BU25DRAFT_238358 [Macroventuria anomochaeta]|uniref:Uncharacterized protein n=1 Tax=Macroventuria anomochaeta TaxID=301207 RepID=A0ACB6RJ16_9PLEO|nr:uncharacterized protein BU25DRAFT_238358 [Macroventuria anomochaeta]KAF2621342.1 hypothetical protein BU25DRAFT_238358 [Macroventuria anomochaeta]